MNFVLTGGERHEAVAFPEMVKGGKVKRKGRGRFKHRSRYVVGDKAYSSQQIRAPVTALMHNCCYPQTQQ